MEKVKKTVEFLSQISDHLHIYLDPAWNGNRILLKLYVSSHAWNHTTEDLPYPILQCSPLVDLSKRWKLSHTHAFGYGRRLSREDAGLPRRYIPTPVMVVVTPASASHA